MSHSVHHYTDEEKAELLSNPYTFRVTDCKIVFTLAFKKFLLEEIDKPGMSSAKVLRKAGYRTELFPEKKRQYLVKSIRAEAASEKGLQEPKPVSTNTSVKKHSATQIRELEQRILILEQQLDFLKKSRHLRETGQMPPNNSG